MTFSLRELLSTRLAPFLSITVFAAVVRGVYAVQQGDNPFTSFPISDSLVYLHEAGRILDGDFLGREVFTFGGGAFYNYFLALIFLLFGRDNFLAVQLVQHLMGALACGFIYLAAERLYARWVAVTIGLWASLFAPFLFHEGLLLTGAPSVFFLVLSLYLMVGRKEGRSWRSALGAGVFLGLAALARPNLLILAPLYLVWILTDGWPSVLRRAAPYALCAGVVLVVAPVTARNYAAGKDLVLVSAAAGLNLYVGNNARATGLFQLPPELAVYNDANMYSAARRLASQAAGRELLPSEASDYWAGRALEFMASNPSDALKLLARKVLLFWNASEITNIYKFDFFSDYSFLLRGPLQGFGALAPLGLMGLAWILLSGSRDERFIAAAALAVMVSVVIFFVSSRLRLPVAPMLFLTSGFAISRFVELPGPAARLKATASLLAFIVFANVEVGGEVRKVVESDSFTYLQVARKYMKERDYEKALDYLLAALARDMDNPELLVLAGDAARESGDLGAARSFYHRIIADRKKLPPPREFTGALPDRYYMIVYRAFAHLGIISLREGNLAESERYLREAVTRFPIGMEARKYLARTFELQGKLEDALVEYVSYLRLNPGDHRIKDHALMLKDRIEAGEGSGGEGSPGG
ncbi:MAG TPA: tetratricopeptide repeat protein [Deltaproteobacteria bacterium]|nr:tetratricopeptide repeat protein [Deltaproteobacteria bacterium]